MNYLKIPIVLISVALAVSVVTLAPAARNNRGQSKNSNDDSRVKKTVLVTERLSALADGTSAFAGAAAKNSQLENELVWTFGGKQQRGWYLYSLLIRRTLEVRTDATPTDLAAALAAWQQKMGLQSDGVLNEESLMRMIAEWQSNRIKDRTPADPNQLVTAPILDFYDPERLLELRQVERSTYAAYKRLVAAAMADPTLKLMQTESGELAPSEKYFKIVSAFRSREY